MADLSQDDIDKMLSGDFGDAPTEDASQPPVDLGQSAIDDILAQAGGRDSPAADMGSGGDISQDQIDAMLNQMGGGPVDQSQIDAMLGGGFGGQIDQNDIDNLLNQAAEMAGGPTSDGLFDHSSMVKNLQTGPDLFSGGTDSMDDMQSLLSEIQNDPNLGNAKDEVNIEELLNEIHPDTALSSGGGFNPNEFNDIVGGGDPAMGMAPLDEAGVNIDFLLDMKLSVTFEVGRAKMQISDLLSLGQGSVIELHRLVGEDLDLFVSNKLIAKGEVVVINEKFGVRILDIVTPQDRLKHMAGIS